MKKLTAFIILSALLASLMSFTAFASEGKNTVQVNTPEELMAALGNEACDSIEVAAEMTITDPAFSVTKDLILSADVVFKPAPDEGFFVKSFEVPEGVTLTVKGKFTTESTFDNGFVIAQLFINGGKVDFAEGTPDEFCNICFNSGELIAPKDGFADTVSISRYIYENVTIDSVKEAFETENLRTVVVQEGLEIAEPFTVPEGKTLSIGSTGEPTFITVKNGAGIDGNVSADPGCGVILFGDAHLNDITVSDGAEGSVITWQEDGSFTVEACDAEGNVR